MIVLVMNNCLYGPPNKKRHERVVYIRISYKVSACAWYIYYGHIISAGTNTANPFSQQIINNSVSCMAASRGNRALEVKDRGVSP